MVEQSEIAGTFLFFLFRILQYNSSTTFFFYVWWWCWDRHNKVLPLKFLGVLLCQKKSKGGRILAMFRSVARSV